MSEAKINTTPANWQVTATTIECSFIKEYVTIMVNKDWTAKCVWWAKFRETPVGELERKLPRPVKVKTLQCQGPRCQFVREYVEKLIKEEN